MRIHSKLMMLSVTGLLLAAAGCCGRSADRKAVDATKEDPRLSNVTICQAWEPVNGPAPEAQRVPTVTPILQHVLVQYNLSQIHQDIPGQTQPCLFTHTIPMRMEVTRKDDKPPPYTVWAGPLSQETTRMGSFLFDRSDWGLPGNEGLASISLQRGWGMMIRHHGYPPLRTIRITTGRPRYHVADNALPAAASSLQYAILAVIEPNADDNTGLEYFFMRRADPNEEAKLTLMSISDGTQTATLISGQYVAFDRVSGKFGPVAPLPTLKALQNTDNFKPFVKEAVCAAYKASKEQFFTGPATDCE